MIKVGDLVTWTSKSDKLFGGYYSKNYKAPGIVKSVIKKQIVKGSSPCGIRTHQHDGVYSIYWANGKITREHMCYIRKMVLK